MLSSRNAAIIITICIICFLLGVSLETQAARKKRRSKKKRQPIAVIRVFEGAVLTKAPHSSLKKISAKDLPVTIFSGDALVTYDGRVELRYLANQSLLRILENSKVRIWDEKAGKGKVFREILTQYGRVWARIDLDKRIKNNFVTPTAMAGLTSTEFELSVDQESGASYFWVNQGKLRVNAHDRTVTVAPGHSIEVNPGRPPSNPEKTGAKPAPLVPKPVKKPPKSWWEYLWPFD
jgi:hypothetical protein